MKISFPVVIICILLLDNIHTSNPFCKDSEYACKQEGITQCRPKTDRCYGNSECVKRLPIEKPPCKQKCLRDHEFWCEERGQCINNKEVCDCGPGKVYCDSIATGTYSCENRNGIASSSIFSICLDGSCASDCEGKNTNTGCERTQFKCGKHCKDINEVADFRSCEGKCIRSLDFCHRSQNATMNSPTSSPSPFNGITSSVILGIIIGVIILMLSLIIFLIYKNWEKLKHLFKPETSTLQRIELENLEQPLNLETNNLQNIEDVEESLKSKLKRLQEDHPWLLVEEEHQEKGCYCLICVQAGVDNVFTRHPGATPSDQIIEGHLQVSSKDRDTSLSIATKTNQNKEVSKNSHHYAKQIISEVENFSKSAMKSRSTFSLILYEQINVLAVILKGLKIIDKTESQKAIQDIYIALNMIKIEENSHALSILNEIQNTIQFWEINLEQISSISTVNIGGKLPSKSAEVCESLSQLPKCECITVHNVSHEPTLDMQQENVDNPFQEILQRVLGALTFVLSQSPHGYEILRNKQEEYKEPIITQEMFRQINKKTAKDIVHFVRSCPKSIQATLIKIRDVMEDSNETDENKQRVGGLLKIMDKFTTKATMLLYETISDAFHEVFSHHEEPYFDWNRNAVKGQVKYLKSVLDKLNKEGMATNIKDNCFIPIYIEESNCLKTREIFPENTDIKREHFLQKTLVNRQNDKARKCLKKLFKEAQDEKNITQSEINLFRNYQNQVIQTAVQDLESSFPKESMTILHGMSKVFNTEKITTLKNEYHPDHYKVPMIVVGNKFSMMKNNKEKLKEIDDIKRHFRNEDVRKISGLFITNYSDTFPNFAYMAEIYLNVNLNTPDLQQILLEIDGVIKMTRPKLNLQEKNKKVLVSSIRTARHQLRQQQEINVDDIAREMASLQLNQETMQCNVMEAIGSSKLNMETMQSTMGNGAEAMGSSNLNNKIPQFNPEKVWMYRGRRKRDSSDSDSSDRRRNGGSPSSSRGRSGFRSRSRSR